MNDTTPPQPDYPPSAPPPAPPGTPPPGPPVAGASGAYQPPSPGYASYQPAPPYGQHPTYAQYPAYPQPPAYVQPESPRRSKGWIVALVIVGVFVVGAIAACAWFGSVFSSVEPRVGGGDAVALIHLDGVIAGTSGTLSGGAATPERILDQLKQAEDDDSVKAILLRVDSPGGTVAASEEIATEVGRASKPVVVSIGDVGASGAYMVSSQADWIVAGPGSDVGSIGVILEVPDLQNLLSKLGVKFAVIHAGKFKDIGSPYRSLTATETKLLQEQVDIAYGQFVDIVAKGRKLPADKVRELATGMAWAGTQAKTYGLVDQIGTYNDALDKAAKLGKIDGTPRVVEFGTTDFGTLLDAILGAEAKLSAIAKALDTSTANDATSRPITR